MEITENDSIELQKVIYGGNTALVHKWITAVYPDYQMPNCSCKGMTAPVNELRDLYEKGYFKIKQIHQNNGI